MSPFVSLPLHLCWFLSSLHLSSSLSGSLSFSLCFSVSPFYLFISPLCLSLSFSLYLSVFNLFLVISPLCPSAFPPLFPPFSVSPLWPSRSPSQLSICHRTLGNAPSACVSFIFSLKLSPFPLSVCSRSSLSPSLLHLGVCASHSSGPRIVSPGWLALVTALVTQPHL